MDCGRGWTEEHTEFGKEKQGNRGYLEIPSITEKKITETLRENKAWEKEVKT